MPKQTLSAYSSVAIGSQVWMDSNLQVTCYRNGDPIPQVENPHKWRNSTKGAMCQYEGEKGYSKNFGYLYNGHAVNDPRGLAPEGWRIPEDSDWQKLIDFLGGNDRAGGAMKHEGVKYWKRPNSGATNSNGFSALPAGFRSLYGDFRHLGLYSYFWSSTSFNNNCTSIKVLGYFDSKVIHTGGPAESGYSVRCIKC
ncbi:fibrobacter succinogenes major paralogous domain-containing protein [Prosthecochloris sp. SCSIO W1101]|uniref:fibrobacter succinogenes major paralogous domain-containing protein n=1 Tax=Prosthecochloris sp. SCSIO W1101 TaxID=2992242 RepID=UPI00223CCCC8|nr:fibrobacter succinogenes major paralogous domain-containing protein [Prosthecochloris sp. SCSIO W1101]UZJ42360.1 fibrobacter succinogenes major paralogous domain-containing protein [Prosthecochloris sp. SCSIO W1101]